tara:strand:- start:816 stop:965 length:150 start_codon:yes stop_codon:yes gene_type:complete
MDSPIVQELIDKELDNLNWSIKYHEEKLAEAIDRRAKLIVASESVTTED